MKKATGGIIFLICLCSIKTSVSFSVSSISSMSGTQKHEQELSSNFHIMTFPGCQWDGCLGSYGRVSAKRRKRLQVQRSIDNGDNDGEVSANRYNKNDNDDQNSTADAAESEEESKAAEEEANSRTGAIRKRVASLARNMVLRPISRAYHMPRDIAEVLKEATSSAVDIAMDEVFKGVSKRKSGKEMVDIDGVLEDAFAPMERSLQDMERSLKQARKSLSSAKSHARVAMEVIQAAAIAQAEAAVTAVSRAEQVAERTALADFYVATTAAAAAAAAADSANTEQPSISNNGGEEAVIPTLTMADVDFDTTEMAPPFLNEDQCLVPGEPVVRVEKAPENSRRIFAGIDIVASVDTVWSLLTDYQNLAKVVPNLLVNQVLALYDPAVGEALLNNGIMQDTLPEVEQCIAISKQMKGAKLRQVGGAKVAGINFSARTTLEVREWPQGMPDFAHFYDEMWQGRSRGERASDYTSVKLERYRFPRPFAISKLPTRDISMQSIEGDDGEFRMYQGVWRMQPLPGCGPPGKDAMRLTYAVEVSPRAYLPVALIEGRIVKDMCINLKAIRDYAEKVAAAA